MVPSNKRRKLYSKINLRFCKFMVTLFFIVVWILEHTFIHFGFIILAIIIITIIIIYINVTISQ